MLGKMFHNFEMGEEIFMKLWHNVILINSERSWEFGGCGFIKTGCHALLKIGVLGLKSWSGPLKNLGTVDLFVSYVVGLWTEKSFQSY